MKILFYGTKNYDEQFFEKLLPEFPDIKIKFIEANIHEETASLANGYEAICAFVNADLGAPVIEELHQQGVKLILMRCAGYNNVDLKTQIWHESSACTRLFSGGCCRARNGAGSYS